MYRRDTRMARGQGEVEPRQGIHSCFVERVVKLPMFHVAWDYASNTYSSIKESNRLVNFTLTNAEKSVTFITGQAKPVVMKFEKQIQAVDKLACKGLGTLEEKVPLITKSPEEIIEDTRGLYTNNVTSRLEGILKYGNDKVRSIAQYGVHTLSIVTDNALVKSVLGTAEGALSITEDYVEYFLPPEKEENNHVNDRDKKHDDDEGVKVNAFNRLTRISSTIRRRSYRVVMLRIRQAKIRTFKIPENLLTAALENFENANQFARKLWVTLSTEETPDAQQSQNFVMKRVLPIARPVVKQLVTVYLTIVEILPLPTKKEKNESNNANNNGHHFTSAATPLVDGFLRVVGLVRTIPALLPVYLYIVFSWMIPGESDKSEDDNVKVENNCTKHNRSEQNHVMNNDHGGH